MLLTSSCPRWVVATAALFWLTASNDGEVIGADTITDAVNWSEMLADHDLTWNRLPQTWKEAPFLGNGEQGTMMYQIDAKTLRWDVGDSAAHDHRPLDQDDLAEKNAPVLNRGRHFIGHLRVIFPKALGQSKSKLSLWDAEASGTIRSEAGAARWTTMVHATEPVMRFELSSEGELDGARFSYVPEQATNPRAIRAKTPRNPANPPPVVTKFADGVQVAVHNLHAGGQTAVAWLTVESGHQQTLWLSVKHSYPERDASSQAVSAVRTAAAADPTDWITRHRDWWHRYYRQSFVSTGDRFWDAFYWIQQYKLASATRDKGWILDNQGPWLQPTAWNATWWNLNAQLAHSGFAGANRRGMGSALSHRLDLCRDNLARNVAEAYQADSYALGRSSSGWDLLGHAGQPGTGRPPMDANIGRECANLLWALHNVDLEYRYWQDTSLRDRVLYPLLVRAVNYYRHFLTEEADGYLHLPETYSPEYRKAADCTYDLDLLRWGNARLLSLAAEMGVTETEEPLITKWQEIQTKLVPTHVNDTGRMIGRNVALTGRHRHFSHLLAIYPLRTLTPETPADRELIETSLDHWHSFGGSMAGYSLTGGACLAAVLGDGDRALEFLGGLKSFLHTNTFYSEAGGLPVIETPLHGATTIQEMLLQSWGGRLRVFPAVPQQWSDVQFHRLRGEGAYLVSARREQGATQWLHVSAEAGGSVEVQPQLAGAQWVGSAGVKVEVLESGVYQVDLPKEGHVLFWPQGQQQPEANVTSVPRHGSEHRFGLFDTNVDHVSEED
ncbi:glycosyl hydrolase family 95 catalytic domain-containing protein [Novipirellula sp. SH528]|uniref:glycosyl hydrolase family 95 catalytic domain-containing protein n=1 Tax=Novipirellula sp. SH528 TaxID=3454466 RepID=UPI003F9EEDF8